MATVSTPVHASSPDGLFWDALCSAGAVRACASIRIQTVRVDAQNNYVQVLIRNLQGFDPRDNTGGSVFDVFGLDLPNSPWVTLSSDVPRTGTVGSVGLTRPPGWVNWGNSDGYQASFGYLFQTLDWRGTGGVVDVPGQPGDGIRGCDLGPQRSTIPPGAFYGAIDDAITCAALGFTGWATVSTFSRPDVNGPYNWDITGASYSIGGYTKDGTPFSIAFPAGAAIVTPEPSSIVLLASGLALVAAAGWRRSRKARTL